MQEQAIELHYTCTVEPRFADTFGTMLKCPDYRGVLISGVFIEQAIFIDMGRVHVHLSCSAAP